VLKEPTWGTLTAGCPEVVSGATMNKTAATVVSRMNIDLTATPVQCSIQEPAVT
jgi:hypothetical protein